MRLSFSPRVLVIVLVCAGPFVQAQPDETQVPSGELTLAEAKRTALSGNPGVAAILARMEAAEAVVQQAISAARPQVAASAGAGCFPEMSLADGNGSNMSFYSAGLTANWLLFDGAATRFRVEAARAGTTVSLAEWDDARRLLSLEVSNAFLSCLLAGENGRVARRDADFNRELLEEARKRFDAGAGPRVDVLNFSVRTREAENSLLGTERDLKTARQALAALMGIGSGSLPDDVVLTPVTAEVVAESQDADTAIQTALGQRSDLRRYDCTIQQAESMLAANRAQYRPSLYAQASYTLERFENPGFDAGHDATSYVGLALTWDLLDGSRRKYTIAETNAQLLELTRMRNQLRVNIAAEVRQKLEALQTSARQYENQCEITGMSQEIREIVRKEYLSGLAALTRLNEVQTDLVRAEGNRSRLRLLHEQASEELSAALGANVPE